MMKCFNPYSNGSSFFIIFDINVCVFIVPRFNPYSNGSSFFIIFIVSISAPVRRFNPYSNGSSFFIIENRVQRMDLSEFQSLF